MLSLVSYLFCHLTVTDKHVRMENCVCRLVGVSRTDSMQRRKSSEGEKIYISGRVSCLDLAISGSP